MTRILYFCPDFPQPSGGVKTLYRHVVRLGELGFDAYIVHQRRGFVASWHGYHAPILWLQDQPTFGAEDVCVFPEVMTDYVRQTQGFRGRRVVFALSWAPGYARLRPGERWQDLGVTQVITKSPVIQRYLEWGMGLAVTLIAEHVDATRYAYDPARKQPQIAYLTRKDAAGEWLQGIMTRKGGAANHFHWRPLRNLSEEDYAQHLRASTVYLTTNTQEGMNVSVLEAMACGCLVVGYAGVGGHAYMVGKGDRQNCVLVENGNLPLLGETVEQTLERLRAHPHAYDATISNALATAQPYQDPEPEAQSLKRFYEQFLP